MMNHEKAQEYYAYKGIKENPIILDFSKAQYLSEIHKVLKVGFGLPDYYGENPDALWDLLDGLFNEMGDVVAEIYGFNGLDKGLKRATLTLLEVLEDVHNKTPNFSYKII